MVASKQFTKEEVAKHNKQGDLWLVIDGKVFDVSKFAAMHPGGLSVLLDEQVAGQDATEAFFGLHRHEVLLRPQFARLQIGVVAGESPQILPRAAGALSTVPYAEPTWLTPGYHSPYFTDKHRAFQAAVRKFCEEVVLPDALAREEDGKPPSPEVWAKLAEANILAMRLGPGPHLKGRKLMGGIIEPEELTIIHSLILIQEFNRLNARGYADGLGNGAQIGLPPILHHATPALRDKIAAEYFAGKKFVSLAISEAFAGSDVSRLKTFATRTDEGWRVTGTKKWITGGTAATYFTVGCRSAKGMVVLVIERGPGVETKPIKTSYSSSAGTAFVTFENVLVPFENQLGEDGNGLHVILANFNQERWGMTAATISAHRMVVEECLKWTTQRKVFGKPLVSQAVIRSKLAGMISRVESAQARGSSMLNAFARSEEVEGPSFRANPYRACTRAESIAHRASIQVTYQSARTSTEAHQMSNDSGSPSVDVEDLLSGQSTACTRAARIAHLVSVDFGVLVSLELEGQMSKWVILPFDVRSLVEQVLYLAFWVRSGS